MVTGGFRRRDAMEAALASGAADVIGLGRPMCVDTDAPAALLRGDEELQRYEDQLSLFPSWLGFLTRVGMLRTLSGFSVQYWYYQQLDALGRTGRTDPGLGVIKASRLLMGQQKRWLAERAARAPS